MIRRKPLFVNTRRALRARCGTLGARLCVLIATCVLVLSFVQMPPPRVVSRINAMQAKRKRHAVVVDGFEVPAACHARPHLDAAGSLAEGARPGTEFRLANPGACCDACTALAPKCNVWVFNTNTSECWLKNAPRYPERPIVYGDKTSPWMSGSLWEVPRYKPPETATCIHTVVTSNGNAYMNWQTRIMHASWMRVATKGDSALRAFTRVLHAEHHDDLSKRMHTMVFPPKTPNTGFPVAERAAALLEWSHTPDARRCSHILMAETDYVFVKPITFSALPAIGNAVGFHFGYVSPSHSNNVELTRRFVGDSIDPDDVPQTGNSPQIMHFSDLGKVLPLWMDMHARVEADEQAVKTFGWVRDMYSYSFAAAKSGIRHHVPLVPFNPIMVQIPADSTLGDAAIIHYTWGPRIRINGTELWTFDKREYGGGQFQANIPLKQIPNLPPWNPNMRLQAEEEVTRGVYDVLALFVREFNECVTFATSADIV